MPGLFHPDPVFGAGNTCLAPTGTLVHVIVEAGTVFAHIPGKLLAASRQLQGQPNGLHDAVGDTSAAVGAEILSAIVGDFAHQFDFGVNILHIQPQVGIPLVILQQNIVFGGIPLDQAAFQHQGLKLRSCHDHVEVMYMADHDPGFGAVGCGVLEILADAVFQLLGLAHVDDLVIFVSHDIHTRRKGQGQRFVLQFIKGHNIT